MSDAAPWEDYAAPASIAAPASDDAGPWNDYAQSAQTVSAPTAAPPETARRIGGLADRALIQGIGQLADAPGALLELADRAGASAHNYIRGLFGLKPDTDAPLSYGAPATDATSKVADAFGLPTPATPGERVASAAVSALPSSVVAPGARIPAAISSAAGGASGQTAAEMGAGKVGQLVAGVVGGGLAGGATGSVTRAESAATSPAVKTLIDAGVPLNLAQATGNKIAQHIDRASQMLSSGAAEFAENQQQALNGALLKSVGVSGARAATPEVLQAAKSKITGVMDAAAERGTALDPLLESNLNTIQENLAGQVPESAQGPILRNLSDLRAAAAANGGTVPGSVLQRVRTNLGVLSKNPQVGEAAGDLQDVIDDAVQRHTLPADQAALTQARQQYRALKQIEPNIDADGNISIKGLMNTLNTKVNTNQTKYGQGDQSLVTLAKAARSVIPDALGNSGTSERFVPILTLLDAIATEHPINALLHTAGTVAAGTAAAKLLRNQTVVRNAPAVTAGALTGAASGAKAGSLGAQFGVGAQSTAQP